MTEQTALARRESPIALPEIDPEVLESIVKTGDMRGLTWPQQWSYYLAVCNQFGLDPTTRPFDIITEMKDGKIEKVSLYGNKECATQIRQRKRIDIYDLKTEIVGDQYIVTAYARDADGRVDTDLGAVPISGRDGRMFTGTFLSNAILKSVTKAKRRVTLSIAGLGAFLDVTEAHYSPAVQTYRVQDVIEADGLDNARPTPASEVLDYDDDPGEPQPPLSAPPEPATDDQALDNAIRQLIREVAAAEGAAQPDIIEATKLHIGATGLITDGSPSQKQLAQTYLATRLADANKAI